MKLRVVYFILFVFLNLVAGFMLPVSAQTVKEATGFRSVKIWLNPEYDDPRLLVMMQGNIVGTEPPVNLRFLVPSDAEMYSAGSIDALGSYSGGPPLRQTSSITGWDEISYELKTDTFRVEYYTDKIIGTPEKRIAYDFLRLYPISDMTVTVQQPRTATNFTVNPAGVLKQDDEGFTVRSTTFTNLAVDTPVHFEVSYTKTDPHPSFTNTQTSGSAPTGATSSNIIGWVLGIIAAFIVGGGTVWILLTRRPKAVYAPPARRRDATAGARQPSSVKGGKTRPQLKNVKGRESSCPECGRPLPRAAQVCPNCGNQLDS